MNANGLRVNDWVRAATRVHMVMSQSISDEELEEWASPVVTAHRPRVLPLAA